MTRREPTKLARTFGELRDLRKLKLKTTDLADAGLRHLNDLVKIKELWLTSPKVTGDGLASLAGMRQMEELILEAPLDARLSSTFRSSATWSG